MQGRFVLEDRVSIAIVGARMASAYGRGVARELAAELVARPISVVSGMARGIDAEAHQATLEAGGRTIAVLGSGLDVVYPREHIALAEHIAANGAVVSEFGLGSRPEAGNFSSSGLQLNKALSANTKVYASIYNGSFSS